MQQQPRIVLFFGGENGSRDLSQETGYWACQYLPRSKYEITPVQVTADGLWQVPLGSLPKQGPVDRMLSMLFKSVRALSPAEGLQRLLSRPVAAMMSLVRGRGGDDGSLKALGQSLKIPVAGSSVASSQNTWQKHLFAKHVEGIASVPAHACFDHSQTSEEIFDEVRAIFAPPLFIKPVNQESSFGVQTILNEAQLLAALKNAQGHGDFIVQEKVPGAEISLTLTPDERGKLIALPPTVIVPRHSQYFDHLAKRKPGRVTLHSPHQDHNLVLAEAEAIAREVYDELGMSGHAAFDMFVDDDQIRVLEVNTVPVFSEATPLKQQLLAAQWHPGRFFDALITHSQD